ncbi:TROVE domain-containing protein [Acetatifactor muris]|uniref:TROVE domain protein n=1 Tax=Acetatifactor muris TaxID=879566 RepID=A0A2K4ZDF5_9FIRM|nr:TROVE domain-containing protein [Acetatifactor muris]MCI8799372.1 TROVE domain-containing protein [Lachnospiraceae bacterium]MCR2046931.1 TROVE domain-containing protein [Acetatifactor muris]SOY28480.1 TROVE domain protein [Acetatifactor muris]
MEASEQLAGEVMDLSRFREVLGLSRKYTTVENFMGGESYQINPLDTLKMVTASSVFGEPSYYRAGGLKGAVRDALFEHCKLLEGYLLFADEWDGHTTTEIMENAVDEALTADFEGTLRWAVSLRQDFYMRLNPQVIMVRAALHPARKKFTQENPGLFPALERQVMSRGDDALSQLAYFLYCNQGKRKMPSILKRALARRLEQMDAYEAAKYKNAEMGLKDAVRITHAHSAVIDEFMKTGNLQLPAQKKTWENMRSEGMGWREIFGQVSMGHMALIRNLRGVFEETEDREFCREYLERLKGGVEKGRQFPFRYYSAWQAVKKSTCAHRPQIMDALEECMDLSMKNLPVFQGKTMCLSDNSGSAWGTIPSEYGSVQVAVIDNLSSVMAAAASEEGYVGKFGDRLKIYPISGRGHILRQCQEISAGMNNDVGGSTEGGIWEFFFHAIEKKEHWDQIFIYSDQQAGHGGLYGTGAQRKKYQELGYSCNRGRCGQGTYINVFDLILAYRRKVNPRVNVFSIQTAGYNNVCIPEYAYRTCILYGWTGRELSFARQMIDLWDEKNMEKF